jgi:hypothetical protein
VNRKTELLQVVRALGSASGLASRLHRGQQERDQDRNDGDDNEQFDKGETSTHGAHGKLRSTE